MPRPSIAFVVLALALAAPAAADQWVKSYPIQNRPDVSVTTSDARVSVTPSDRKEVTITVTTEGWKIGEHGVRVDVVSDGDHIRCQVHEPLGLNFVFWPSVRSIRVEVRMPRDGDLDARTSDGAIQAGPLSGRVSLHTSDGSIEAVGLKGDLHLSSSDGRIRGAGLDGSLEAQASDGRVTLEGRFDHLDVHSGDGHIDVTALAGSRLADDWRVHTSDGGVTMRIPGSIKANLDISTGDGSIHVGMPFMTQGSQRRSRLEGQLNGGGPTLRVTSGDGSVRIDPL